MNRILLAVAAALLLGGAAARAEEEAPPRPDPLDRVIRGVFIGPIRYRHEYRDDQDVRAEIDDSDSRDLLKLGFGADARPVDPLRARVQLRTTRSWGRNAVNKKLAIDPFGQDHVDLFEGFGEVGPFEGVPISLRVGRQVLLYGEERLVGPLEFVQNPRAWDAVRLLLAAGPVSLDAWWGRRVQFEGPDDRNRNRPVDTVDFFGLYGSAKVGPDLVVEPFYLVKYDDNSVVKGERGDADHHVIRHSPGVRAVWKAPLGLTLGADGVLQFGERGRDDILAWGAAAKVVWRAPEGVALRPELEIEYIFGSGDTNPADGDANTLDNFYPTNHKFYGEIDFTSWQNIHDLELTGRLELYRLKVREPPPEGAKKGPSSASRPIIARSELNGPMKPYVWERVPNALPPVVPIVLEVSGHLFRLAARKDAWYNAALAAVRRDPTGRAGRDLGREVDLVLRAGPLSAGWAHFFPGDFVERTAPAGARTSGADYAFVELAVSF